jgi:N6-adenosine-specific RNA methylase IME4
VELSRRRDNLSWSHHQEVAKLDAADQDAWLDRTALEAWTQKELRRQLRAGPSVDPPTGSYSVIYADPPWEYDFVATPDSRAVENHYPTMSLEAIKTLPVPADDPAVLFLWATTAKLTEAIEVVGAWGFNYRTSAVWVKDRIGMGYYVRGRHEFLLIATRGDASPPPEHRRRDSVIEAPRGAHSVKPDEFYELIEFMYPEATRIELFARRPREGWVAWGNET